MKIETKFNRKQSVWFMLNNKPTEKYVVAILISPVRSGEYPKIEYELSDNWTDDQSDFALPEKEVYITKAELLLSL